MSRQTPALVENDMSHHYTITLYNIHKGIVS